MSEIVFGLAGFIFFMRPPMSQSKPEELLQKSDNIHTLLAHIENTQKQRRFKMWLKKLWAKLCFWRK